MSALTDDIGRAISALRLARRRIEELEEMADTMDQEITRMRLEAEVAQQQIRNKTY